MSLHQIRVKSVNVHRSNAWTHSMLENGSEFELLLIQEPWFNVVATLHSDTDPMGVSQLGVAMHPEWDAHLPKHRNSQICKAIAYFKKSLVCSHIVENVLDHPLANYILIHNNIRIIILDSLLLTRLPVRGCTRCHPSTASPSSHGGSPAHHHVVAISPHGFLPDNRKPGSESDRQKESIGTIFMSRALNLSWNDLFRVHFLKILLLGF